MLFTSYQFIAFVIISLILYYLVPKKLQWIVLLCMNTLFYVYAGISGIIFIVTTIVTTFFGAVSINNEKEKCADYLTQQKDVLTKEQKKDYKLTSVRKQKIYLALPLIINFGILAVLKYTNLFIVTFTSFNTVDFILPMGISFYTFQSTGYLVDVYRGIAEVQKNPFRYALFVSFFPQLVQGPISRWNDLKTCLFEYHDFSWSKIQSGLERMLWGYFKKMVIADRAAIGLATIQSDCQTYYGAYAFVGMILYAIDLYADFTGGIDITIGVAEMFGIKLPENFKRPFFSKNIAEYWRRWHITLCAWFKDYLFYPISMSKWMNKLSKKLKNTVGKAVGSRFPVYFSSLTVWFVTGIWHGASWNFVVWGLLNSLIMLISQEFKPLYDKADKKFGYRKFKYYKVFEIIRTTAIVCSLQMLDYYRNISEAFKMFFSMFTSGNYYEVFTKGMWNIGISMPDYIVIAIGVLIIFIVSMLQRKCSIRQRLSQNNYCVRYVVFLLLFLAIVVFGTYGIGYESSQFIYNQF
ncbi:MAG: MBOAT family O-acyltransferase [Eubacteriales bacterium]|nr:MBOAT family O-acyltransferase [Eubacteriales bacterium]